MHKKSMKTQKKSNGCPTNALSSEKQARITAKISGPLQAKDSLELNFDKNNEPSFITEDTLILGCDIGNETHYLRAIDIRGRELGKKTFSFSNNTEGFRKARKRALKIAAANQKSTIVLGLEPTGNYWFCLAAWMVSQGICVIQVNPYTVKQMKELEDNSQRKDDRKDPGLIANLVKDGNIGISHLPKDVYAEIKGLSMLIDQLIEDRVLNVNRLHREIKIYFPEYEDVFGKIDGVFSLALLKEAPFPEDLLALGVDGIKDIWRKAGLREDNEYTTADKLMELAWNGTGLKNGAKARNFAVRLFASTISQLDKELEETQTELYEKCLELPYV